MSKQDQASKTAGVSTSRAGAWRIWRTPAYIVGLTTTLALAGCAAEATDTSQPARVDVQTGTSHADIFGGDKDDDGSALGGVVALRVGTGGTFELCSGALVAPNLVLTARHCVTKNLTSSVSCDENGRSANGAHVSGDELPQNVGVYVGAAPQFAQHPTAVAKAIVSPKGQYLCDSDIALVVLDQPIPNVTPLAVRLKTAAQAGEAIRSVGYGQNDEKLPIGTRFRKDGVTVLAQGKAVSASKTPLGLHEFEVGKSICQGDSGGPAISEETGAVIGVVSRGGHCDEDYGHIYTTTAGFDDLFEEAFALAGATPKQESAPRSKSVTNDPQASDEAATSGGSCAASPRGSHTGGAAAWAGLTLGVAVLLRRRRRC